MPDQHAHHPPPAPAISPLRRLINWLLTLGGVGLFFYLVASSGITLGHLRQIGWAGFGLLILVSATVIAVDTVAWFYAVRHVARPAGLPLFGLRIAGDALTNALPGGVVLGETYKAAMLKRWWGVAYTDSAASLMMVKFGLGCSQAVFVTIGLCLCFVPLRQRSVELIGMPGAQYISLAMTVGIGLFMAFPLTLMFKGDPFAALARGAARLPIAALRRKLDAWGERIDQLDTSCRNVLHGNRKHLTLVFGYLLAGWIISAAESYVMLHYMGHSPSLRTAFVMESVGSMFRLVFFLVPSGIGGQDASFMALFKLYNLPTAAAGTFVLFKRFKELLWIGIGFLLALAFRAPAAAPAGAAPATTPSETKELS